MKVLVYLCCLVPILTFGQIDTLVFERNLMEVTETLVLYPDGSFISCFLQQETVQNSIFKKNEIQVSKRYFVGNWRRTDSTLLMKRDSITYEVVETRMKNGFQSKYNLRFDLSFLNNLETQKLSKIRCEKNVYKAVVDTNFYPLLFSNKLIIESPIKRGKK